MHHPPVCLAVVLPHTARMSRFMASRSFTSRLNMRCHVTTWRNEGAEGGGDEMWGQEPQGPDAACEDAARLRKWGVHFTHRSVVSCNPGAAQHAVWCRSTHPWPHLHLHFLVLGQKLLQLLLRATGGQRMSARQMYSQQLQWLYGSAMVVQVTIERRGCRCGQDLEVCRTLLDPHDQRAPHSRLVRQHWPNIPGLCARRNPYRKYLAPLDPAANTHLHRPPMPLTPPSPPRTYSC